MLNVIVPVAMIARVAFWMLALPLLKRLLPLPRLASLMWVSTGSRARDRERERVVLAAVARVYGRGAIPRRHNCLERALVAYRFLSASGANPTLVIGVRAPDAAPSGHAWVLVDGMPVLEDEQALAGMSPILLFGRRGRLVETEPTHSAARCATS